MKCPTCPGEVYHCGTNPDCAAPSPPAAIVIECNECEEEIYSEGDLDEPVVCPHCKAKHCHECAVAHASVCKPSAATGEERCVFLMFGDHCGAVRDTTIHTAERNAYVSWRHAFVPPATAGADGEAKMREIAGRWSRFAVDGGYAALGPAIVNATEEAYAAGYEAAIARRKDGKR